MTEITLEQYMMGRDKKYPDELLPEYIENATRLLEKVNALLEEIVTEQVTITDTIVTFEIHPVNKSLVSSGWRPPQVNASTSGAAPKSKHMTCNAIDIYDPDGDLDDYLMDNTSLLKKYGLSMEHPSATKGWCHLQQIPPRSGKTVFYP